MTRSYISLFAMVATLAAVPALAGQDCARVGTSAAWTCLTGADAVGGWVRIGATLVRS